MHAEKIEVCPFCGKEPSVIKNSIGIEYARCITDGCVMAIRIPTIEAWNRRANNLEGDRQHANNTGSRAICPGMETCSNFGTCIDCIRHPILQDLYVGKQ
jgi:hypothetical protein